MNTKILITVRKSKSILLFTLLFLAGLSVSAAQGEQPRELAMKEATFIPFTAKPGQSNNLEAFLQKGAKLVTQTEPNTLFWYALMGQDGSYGIIDFFPNEEGRAEHFAGQVAGALNESSSELVLKGWDEGIVANISNASVLSSKQPEEQLSGATEATYILLNAQPGMEQTLENLLTGAANVIKQTEPNTLLWTALKLSNNTFAIFDTFTDETARAVHFDGKVAAALKDQADALVVGGWENGVLKNIHNFSIIAEAGK